MLYDWLCLYVIPLQRCFHWNTQFSSTYTTGSSIWMKQNGKRELTSQSSTNLVILTTGRCGTPCHSNSATIGAQFHHARLEYQISIFRIRNINITKLVYVSKALQQPPIPGAWMQKHTCLGRHTNLHVSAKLSLKLSELNKYRNSFTIFFPVKSVNLYFRKIRSDIFCLLFAYSQKVGQSEFYTRSAGMRQHLRYNLTLWRLTTPIGIVPHR